MKIIIFLIVLTLGWMVPAAANTSIPWADDHYQHFSNNQDVKDVLRDLARNSGFAVSVSDEVSGKVNGEFDQHTHQQVFDILSKIHGFLYFFDGVTLWVSSLDEIATATVRLEYITVETFEYKLEQLQISSPYASWRVLPSDRIAYIAGPGRYIDLVSQIALDVDKPGSKIEGQIYTNVDANGHINFSDKPIAIVTDAHKAEDYKVVWAK